MDIRLKDHFDGVTLERGRDYAQRGFVVAVEPLLDGALRGRVSNGRGKSYQQRITMRRALVDGICSCPVGYNCKHVVAVLMTWAAQQYEHPSLAAPVQGWLSRVRQSTQARQLPEIRPEDYPDKIKERLLYVLNPHDAQVKIDTCKGRSNAAGTALRRNPNLSPSATFRHGAAWQALS